MAIIKPRKKDIAQIKTAILRPSLTSHYRVTVGGAPPPVMKLLGVEKDQLSLLCSEAVLPGSNLNTMNINDNYTGVTEKHAYRRTFDDRINLTFYVPSNNYLPIRFFEEWHSYIMNEDQNKLKHSDYNYRCRYPESSTGNGNENTGYMAQQGLEVTKFERDYAGNYLTYHFVKSYPLSISSMPVSYDTSSLLKCSVAMTYIRYWIEKSNTAPPPESSASDKKAAPEKPLNLKEMEKYTKEKDKDPYYKSKVTDPTLKAWEKYTTKTDPYSY